MKANLFIVGAPKCGTTALAYYLEQHPNVCMAKPKEPWYFSKDLAVNRTTHPTSIEEYHTHFFGHYDPSKHKIVGDASPSYLMSNDAINNILEYYSESKFIAMVRNPIEIAYAMHSTLIARGDEFEDILDFETAWRAQHMRLSGSRLPPNVIKPDLLQYKKLASIGTQLDILLGKVNASNLLVIVNDDMKMDTRKTYQDTLQFLNLEAFECPDLSHSNRNLRWKNPMASRFFNLAHKLNSKLPFSPKLGILSRIRSKALVEAPRRPLAPDFRKELEEVFKPEVDKLSSLLGRDFSHWK